MISFSGDSVNYPSDADIAKEEKLKKEAKKVVKPKPKPKSKKTPFEEEIIEWNKILMQFIERVNKSYETDPYKEKYDLIVALDMAKKCLNQ